eukprot:gene5783-11683_t
MLLLLIFALQLLSNFGSPPILPSAELIASSRAEFIKSNPCIDSSKNIPCHIWVTGRSLSHNQLPRHIQGFSTRNKDWILHPIDDEEMRRFMKSIFSGTRVLWAFDHINHQLGASRADIWRLAVLWIYGGVYIDLDADILTPLSQVIQSNDSFILGTEGNPLGQCYKPEFHLNHSVIHTTADWYQGKSILQWTIFSEPGHLFLERALKNVVELITLEYKRQSVVVYESHEGPAMLVFCCTGPVIFTASILEVINEQHENVTYRYVGRDFSIYGGEFKAKGFQDTMNGARYESLMNHRKAPFLKKYEND